MSRFRDLPIRRKLAWMNVLSAGVALALAGVAFIAYDLFTFRAGMVHEMSTQAKIVGENTASALLFNDRASAAETLAALRAQSHIIKASVLTAKGVPFATYVRADARPSPEIDTPSAGASHRFAQDRLVVVEDILVDGERVGSVRISSDLREVDDRLRRYFVIVVLVMLVSTMTSFAISSRLQTVISGPILHLVNRAREVSEKQNYAVRATPSSDDELGLLIRTFNEMLGQIQQRDEALKNARDEAESANRAKDEFLAMVSHELRTPLTPILMWTNMLRSGALGPPDAKRGLEVIEVSARSQAQLVEDLLDVSRIISGKLRLEAHPIQLRSVIESAIESVRAGAQEKEIQLRTHFGDQMGECIGDPERLQQVLWNLLSNAIKFTPRSGVVDLRLESDAGEVKLSVEDSGEGIPAALLPHIFERFRQADSTTTRPHGGLGLGLAIVRHLVELHGGTVSAESPGKGRGSRFTVRLPRAEEQTRRAQAAAIDAVATGPRPLLLGIRVLVVDDEAITCESIKTVLTQSGAQVQSALSTSAAMQVVLQWNPDVVVSDIAMPGEDGYSLIRMLRRREQEGKKRVAAIALSAYARTEDRSRALAAGFQMHVAKPVDPTDLVRRVAELSAQARPPR